MKDKTYIAIDLKSFYASVECRERGLDPLDTNLVVADESRTDKTICLAVTPSLKSYGISGRGRLFEVKQRVKEANAGRQHDAPGRRLEGSSHFFSELQADPSLAIDFIIAPPRMAYYMEYSTRIYSSSFPMMRKESSRQRWRSLEQRTWEHISGRWRLTVISSRWTIRSRRNLPPQSAVLPQTSIRFAAASTPPDTSMRTILQS